MKRLLFTLLVALPCLAHAAEPGATALPAGWGLPFAGLLLSIACLPLFAPRLWHAHFGKIALGWALLLLVPYAVRFGLPVAWVMLAHALLGEYLPFVLLLTALYTVAGGICMHGVMRGTPARNTRLLALGALLASVMGTTGASMLLIRPLLRANAHRQHTVHLVVFFIFLVANAGGALSPLGDPPLFLGFLNGVDFFWTTRHLLAPTVTICGALLLLFYAVDTRLTLHEATLGGHGGDAHPIHPGDDRKPAWHIDGKLNLVLLAAVVLAVLASGTWRPAPTVSVLGVALGVPDLLRDAILIALTLISLRWTPHSARIGNAFGWVPMIEVAKLFAAIFVTIAPVIAMLRAGETGALGWIVGAVDGADGRPVVPMYFWATGLLSSFLDNAPTYLVFFHAAGGDAASLMKEGARTLAAISAGAVFMGANTYIGNAPNFMVKSIAEARGVRMPGFFGYLVWSGGILLPLYLLTTWIFFRA
jgi:Na+/H+ antiporter NhaD/arsenite permease-like protein